MAITQAAADKRKVGQLGERVDGGTSAVDNFVVTPMGGVQFMTGTGVPGSEANACPRGSIYIDVATGKMWVKSTVAASSGSATWVDQSA
jgi:2-keto-3-deoxy-6-phosphogluconate aldolase